MHLIRIVKIQRLCERVADSGSKDYEDEEFDDAARAPVSAYMTGFSAGLNKLQAEMPASFRDNGKPRLATFLKLRMATARLRIHEPPNIDAELLELLSKPLGAIEPGSKSALDAFYQSNAALKA